MSTTWSMTWTTTTGSTVTYSPTQFSTTATSMRITPIPSKVRAGKYRVRCRGCGRWAKILSESNFAGWPNWKVDCVRCFGENDGFAA